ncbi:MAG: hypothetical protein WC222_07630 [Parachlamydiales bacterium]|jgi:hypothetical protein
MSSFLVSVRTFLTPSQAPELKKDIAPDQTPSEAISTEGFERVPILPDEARDIIESSIEDANTSHPYPEKPAENTKSYWDYWNTTKFVASEATSFCAYLGKRALLNTASTVLTLSFDYKKEVEQHRKYISEITKSWHLDLIITSGSNKAVDFIINSLENPDPEEAENTDAENTTANTSSYWDSTKKSIINAAKHEAWAYVKDYKEYFRQIIEVVILRFTSKVLENVHKEWDEVIQAKLAKHIEETKLTDEVKIKEAKDLLLSAHPFSTYMLSALLKRSNTFFIEVDGEGPKLSLEEQKKIFELATPEERIDALKTHFGKPFILEIIQKFLPDPTGILPVISNVSSVIRNHVLPRILPKFVDFAGEKLAYLKEITTNPTGGQEVAKKKEFVEAQPGGKTFLAEVESVLNTSFDKLPGLIKDIAVPLASNLTAEFFVKNLQDTSEALKEEKSAKFVLQQMKSWTYERLQGAISEGGNIQSLLPIIKDQLQQYFTYLTEAILKKNPNNGLSLSNNVANVVSAELVSFFKEHKEELLAFEESLKELDENKRAVEITKKYAPLCKKFLASIHTHGNFIIEKFVVNLFPSYMHAFFIAFQGPVAEREKVIKEIVAMATGDLTKQMESVVAANEQFVDDASAALGNFISSMSREQLQSSEKDICKILPDYSPEVIKDTLDWFTASNQNDIPALVWTKVDELIQTAILHAGKNLMEKSSIDLADMEGEEAVQTDLGNVLILLSKIINESGQQIEPLRLEEYKLHRANLQALNANLQNATNEEDKIKAESALAQEETRHAQKLGEIFAPFVVKFMGSISIENQQAVVNLLPPKLQSLSKNIIGFLWEKIIPQVIGKMYEKTRVLSDNRDQLQLEVTKLYDNGLPVLYSRVQALYVKAWLPKYLASELKKANHNVGTAPSESVVDKVIDGIAKFYESKGAKIANLDKTTGQRVAEYIRANKTKLSSELALALEKTGQQASLDSILNSGVDYVEGILLQVFKGLYIEVEELEKSDPTAMVRLLNDWLKTTIQRLRALNEDGTFNSESLSSAMGVAAPETRRLLDRIVGTFGIDMKSAPLPDQGKKALWDVLNDVALPNAFSTVVSNFVNENTLRKIILTALETYHKKDDAKRKLKEDTLEQYRLARREAILQSKELPVNSEATAAKNAGANKVNAPSTHDKAVEGELSGLFGVLLKEIATATGDPVIRMLLNSEKLNKTVSDAVAVIAYENIAGKKIIEHTLSGLSAALGNLQLAEEDETGTLKTIKKISIVHEGKIAHILNEDEERSRRVTDYKFNLQDKKVLPVVLQEQQEDDDLKFNSIFSFARVSTYMQTLFNGAVKETQSKLTENDKINQLISDIGLNFLKSTVRDKLIKYWEAFQDGFYAGLKKVPGIGNHLAKLKLMLDDFCWLLFSYTLGPILAVMARGANAVYENRIHVWHERIFEKLNGIFDKELLATAGSSTLNHLENARIARLGPEQVIAAVAEPIAVQ